jgi:putative transposase
MEAARELAPEVGVATSCRSLGVARATFYRSREKTPEAVPDRTKPRSPRALSEPERGEVLSVLHEPELVDRSPAAVYAWLLDERQTYLCSIRTMYRILASNGEVRERRDQRRHPRHPVPRLVASRPNQVWTWDITKLLGPAKWTYFYLYVILDLFSRYVVGWLLAREESARLARELIAESCRRQGIVEDQLTVHADRGPSMTAKSLALLLADLGVTKSHSRPRVSNDNPYSEAQFKTLKYRPQFPPRFGAARACLLPGVLPLVQPGALSLEPGPAQAGDGALRPCRGGSPGSGRSARSRLRRASGAIRAPAAAAGGAARGGLDQQAELRPRARGGWTLNSIARCLKSVDIFRRAAQ